MKELKPVEEFFKLGEKFAQDLKKEPRVVKVKFDPHNFNRNMKKMRRFQGIR